MGGSSSKGTFKVTADAKPKPGAWYFGFVCLACDHPFAVFDDRSRGKVPLAFGGDGHFRVACPHCKADRLYEGARCFAFRHAVN